MARIIKLADTSDRFGFKRVSRRRSSKKPPGQLHLFEGKPRILQLPNELSLFEEALLLHERGDALAATKYRAAIAKNDCVADAWCNLGIIESQSGRQQEALLCFSHSLQTDPTLFEAHYNIANLYAEQQNLDAARVHYEIARSLDSSFAKLYFNLGLVQAMQDDLESAASSLRRYRELASGSQSVKAGRLLRQLEATISTGEKGG